MTAARSQVTAGAAAALTAVAGITVIWLGARMPELASDPAGSAANSLFVVGMTVLAGTGVLLVRSGSHPVMGWLLVGTGLANVVGRLVLALAVAAHTSGHVLGGLLGWVTNWGWLPGQGLALLLLLRFPDGRLPGRGWSVADRAVLAWTAIAVLVTAFVPGPLGAEQLVPLTNPLGLTFLGAPLNLALGVVFAIQPVLVLIVVAGQAVRWRKAAPEQRRQLTAVALALGFVALATPLALASGTGVVAEGLAWLMLPVAIAYAMARHGLWDVELRRRFDRLRRVRQEERSRLQRDLHDSLGPLLGSIGMRVEAARNLLDEGAPSTDIDRVLASIGAETETAVVEVRRFIQELGPSALADTDLVTALHRLAEGYAEAGIRVTLRVPADLPPLDAAAEVALYRVAGEALHNVARHADATTCLVTLRTEGGDVVLEVVDDGLGLRNRPAGVGRRAMAERVAALGGTLALTEPASGGVQVTARLVGATR